LPVSADENVITAAVIEDREGLENIDCPNTRAST